MFMVLLSNDNLSSSDRWWQKARIWRLAFLQRADGSWVPGRGLELALLANHPMGEDDAAEAELVQYGSDDCPLSFSPKPVVATIPDALKALAGEPQMGAPRQVWATLLAMAVAETLDFCWLAEEDAEDDSHNLTMVDKAAQWLSGQPAALRSILPALHTRAHEVVSGWQRNQVRREADFLFPHAWPDGQVR